MPPGIPIFYNNSILSGLKEINYEFQITNYEGGQVATCPYNSKFIIQNSKFLKDGIRSGSGMIPHPANPTILIQLQYFNNTNVFLIVNKIN